MTDRLRFTLLAALLAVLAIFVWQTSQALPPVVGSHFSFSGHADGFMSRGRYVGFMLALVIGLPLFVVLLPTALLRLGDRNINIPNREFWLAPERRVHTRTYILERQYWIAGLVALFVAWNHWLTVRAHAIQPPVLPGTGFAVGTAIFIAAMGVLVWSLYARFRQPA